jgi:hypothetical protein
MPEQEETRVRVATIRFEVLLENAAARSAAAFDAARL